MVEIVLESESIPSANHQPRVSQQLIFTSIIGAIRTAHRDSQAKRMDRRASTADGDARQTSSSDFTLIASPLSLRIPSAGRSRGGGALRVGRCSRPMGGETGIGSVGWGQCRHACSGEAKPNVERRAGVAWR